MIAVLEIGELMNRNLIIAGLILASVTSFAGWEYTQIELNGSTANVLRNTESGWGFKASYEYNVGLQIDGCYESPSDGATLDFSGEILNLMPNLRGKEITIVKIGRPFLNRWNPSQTSDHVVNLKSLVLPETLKTINEFAFWNCTNLTYLAPLPTSLTMINRGAFENTSIENDLVITGGECSIAYASFANTKISSADLTGVTTIGNYVNGYAGVFENCKELTSVKLNPALTYIPDNGFKNCSKLNSVVSLLPNSVTNVGENAFYKTMLQGDLVVPSGCMIEQGAFAATLLTSVDLEKGGNVIGSTTLTSAGAFENCDKLTKIILPSELVTIGNRTFSNCSNLVSITPMFPDTLENFGGDAFKNVKLPEQPLYLKGVKNIGGSAFANQPITALYFGSCLTNIAGGWDKGAFFNCTKLAKVEFPKNAAPCDFGEMTFAKCSSLKELELPAKSVGRYIITGSGVTNITYRACLENFSEKIYTVAYGSQKLTDVYYYGPCPTIDETVKIFYGINAGKLTHHVNETYLSTWAAVTDDGEPPDETSKWINNGVETWIRPWRPSINSTMIIVK